MWEYFRGAERRVRKAQYPLNRPVYHTTKTSKCQVKIPFATYICAPKNRFQRSFCPINGLFTTAALRSNDGLQGSNFVVRLVKMFRFFEFLSNFIFSNRVQNVYNNLIYKKAPFLLLFRNKIHEWITAALPPRTFKTFHLFRHFAQFFRLFFYTCTK